MSRDSTIDRRRFLQATGGTAGAIALAGCFGGDGNGNGNGGNGNGNESGNGGNGDGNESGNGNESEGNGDTETTEVYAPGSLAVEAEDDYTLSMELDQPFHQVLEMLAYSSFAAVPDGLIGDVEGADGEMEQSEFASSNPIGTGPFQFESWEDGSSADVSAFDDYHGEGPELDGIHWEVIQDANASYQYSQNQNSDFIAMPTAQYDPDLVTVEETDDRDRDHGTYGPMNNGETANYLRVLSAGTQYVGFNTQQVEKPVRQAVAYVMNQQRIVQESFKGRGEPASHLTPPTLFPGSVDGYESHAEDYPYGVDESDIESARQVMEDAGYGDNNRVEITLAHQEGASQYADVANQLRDQLQAVYIDVTIEPTPWGTLLERGRSGNLEMFLLGWVMDYPDPHSFMQLLVPEFTNTSEPGPVAYTDWRGTDAASSSGDAWEEIENNREPTDEAAETRGELYREMEEHNWEDCAIIPLYHPYDERLSYDWVDYEPFGSADPSRQKHNQTTKDADSNTLELIQSGSMTTFDPIAATDTASGTVITQMFDGLMMYPNAEITPEGNLATDYEVSEDYLTYTFQLKEDVTFHDGSDLTAEDFVYSWERLAGSENSRRDYFILDNLGVSHETEEVEAE